MRSLFAVLIFFLLSIVATGQEPPPTLAREGLQGRVRMVETGRIEYVFRDGNSVENQRRISYKIAFNEDGNRTTFTNYREDGKVSTRLVYEYDVLGQNTGYEEYFRLGKEPLQGPRKYVFTLDENGRIVEEIVYDTGGALEERFTYRYDTRGNKLEHNMYSWSGNSMGRLVYTYDDEGNQLTETSYDTADAVARKSVSSYDSNGHRMEWAQYQRGVLRYKKIFEYDDEGRVIKQETLEYNKPSNLVSSHAPVPGTILYSYQKGFKETATYAPDRALESKEIDGLDDRGNEISWEYYNADGSARYEKEFLSIDYDSHRNWTKRTHLRLTNGAKHPQPWSAEFRVITYY